MTNSEQEKMDQILQSFKGSKKASPGPELFQAIEDEIYQEDFQNVFTLASWRKIAAAIVLLLGMNLSVLVYSTNTQRSETTENMEGMPSLISDYKFYE